MIFNTLMADLEWFRAGKRSNGGSRSAVRLSVSALPASAAQDGVPADFAPYRELILSEPAVGRVITRQLSSNFTVIQDLKKRRIQAAVVPDEAWLPDPGYHYLVTQPLSLWLKQRSMYFLHAACVAKGNDGILIVGDSGSGKTALSLCGLQAGFSFLTDEMPILSKKGNRIAAHAFPRRIRLDRPVAKRFPELQSLLKTSSAKRLIFSAQSIWPKRIAQTCQPRILLFPKYRPQGPLWLSAVRSTSAMRWLLEDSHFAWFQNDPWTQIARQRLGVFERLAQQVRAYHLHYSNRHLAQIPALLKRLV